jgi:hypothetical protein
MAQSQSLPEIGQSCRAICRNPGKWRRIATCGCPRVAACFVFEDPIPLVLVQRERHFLAALVRTNTDGCRQNGERDRGLARNFRSAV